MKKIISAAGILAIAAASFFAAGSAVADDVVDATPEVVAEQVIASKPSKPEVKLDPFCHSGNGKNYAWIHPANEGQLNGHDGHSYDIFGGTEAECLALNVVEEPEVPVVVTDPTPFLLIAWPMSEYINPTTPSWPQGVAAGLSAPLTIDLATRNLNALDSTLVDLVSCGETKQWQVDGNFDTEPVRAAVAGGSLYGPGDPAEALWGGGWNEAYKLVQIVGPECEEPIEPTVCETKTVQPTATNLNPQGWVLVNGEWTVDGVEFTATNWSDAYAYLAVNFPLSHAATLDFEGNAGDGLFAIILETAAGNIHYEPSYTDPLWTNAAGILPANGGGQGGPFSGTLNDLQSDPTVTGVYAYFTAGTPEASTGVLSSVSAFCYEQPFGFENKPLPENWTSHTEWADGEYDCDDTTVEITRTNVDYTYSNDENGEVVETIGEPYVETDSRALTEQEIADKDASDDCKVVVPPTEPPATPTTTKLPHTGVDGVNLMIGGGIVMLLAGAAALVATRRRAL